MNENQKIRWDSEKSAFTDTNGRVLADFSPSSGADGKLEDFYNITAEELSTVLGQAYDASKDGRVEPDAKLCIAYDPNSVGIFRSRWAANYPDPDDLLIMTRHESHFEFHAYIVLPRQSNYDEESIRPIFEPVLALNYMTCTRTHFYSGEYEGPSCGLTITPPGSCTVREMAYTLSLLRDIVMNKPTSASPADAFSMIRSGAVQSLLGVSESETLEVKREHYQNSSRGKVEFAVEVASFANSKNGGLLVIGARTVTDSHGRDLIAEVGGSEMDPHGEVRYRTILETLVYPEIDGIEMCRTRSALGEIFAILVPGQQRDRMPFIVRSGTDDDRASSHTFQVPIRKGGYRASMRIEEIHRYLRTTGSGAEYFIFMQDQPDECD
ncbi:hypothetical protein AB0E01_05945 [Nocardia vinacea]|uniref:AlbA family DNA-binding domain-containing protein n=1 Tax=Nocardia vinacea TaxID=96468 RepID=UPI0033F05011